MEKILITGGNGYIGARLCKYLAAEGYAVTALCYPEIPDNEEWSSALDKVITGDIRNGQFLEKLAQEGRYDSIIHLVSLDHRASNEGSPEDVTSVNITPTWSLLNIFSKYGLKNFIYFSTVHVYGALNNENVIESKSPRPQAPYALTHLIGEQLCEYYNNNSPVRCIAVRLTNSYGAPIFKENNCWWLVINDLCRMAFEKKEIVLLSDGTPQRDFIHGWDVCKAIKYILIEGKESLFHISSGQTLTIKEIAYKIQDIYKSRYKQELPVKMKEGGKQTGISRYKIDNSKLLATGYNPDWPIERGINDLFDYLEKIENKKSC